MIQDFSLISDFCLIVFAIIFPDQNDHGGTEHVS